MYVVDFKGTKEQFCERLKSHREKVEAFPTTVGVPAPQEIFPIMKIVVDKIKEDDYKLITDEPEEEDTE